MESSDEPLLAPQKQGVMGVLWGFWCRISNVWYVFNSKVTLYNKWHVYKILNFLLLLLSELFWSV